MNTHRLRGLYAHPGGNHLVGHAGDHFSKPSSATMLVADYDAFFARHFRRWFCSRHWPPPTGALRVNVRDVLFFAALDCSASRPFTLLRHGD